ncbi:hypothetical protein RRF57_012393 [Xylaria bambusicola]|uniref:Uncharacterized protein n=1 Tax=Xylaria bambusicola TaxID=326684 RepID=A0AAN7ZDL4_9PEZI
MDHDSNQGKYAKGIRCTTPRQYLGVINTSTQSFQAGEKLYAPLSDTVNIHTTFIACENHVIITSCLCAIRSRKCVKPKIEALFTSFEPSLRMDIKVDIWSTVEVSLRLMR